MSLEASNTTKMLPLKHHLLFVGNPGVGKSTLLNCIMYTKNNNLCKEEYFKSGLSVVSGLTYQLDTKEFNDVIYMDTPGLDDAEQREAAARAITLALKRNGLYRVVFVVTLESGRVRTADITTIKLVLQSAPEIRHYGVIYNKISDNLMEMLEEKGRKNSLKQQITLAQENKPIPFQFFVKKFTELDEKNDAFIRMLELDEFLACLPYIKVNDENVNEICYDEFEKLRNTFESEISSLKKKIDGMEETMKEEQEKAAKKLEEMLKDQQEKHTEEIKQLQEANKRDLDLMHSESEEKREREQQRHNEELAQVKADQEKTMKQIKKELEETKQKMDKPMCIVM